MKCWIFLEEITLVFHAVADGRMNFICIESEDNKLVPMVPCEQ